MATFHEDFFKTSHFESEAQYHCVGCWLLNVGPQEADAKMGGCAGDLLGVVFMGNRRERNQE